MRISFTSTAGGEPTSADRVRSWRSRNRTSITSNHRNCEDQRCHEFRNHRLYRRVGSLGLERSITLTSIWSEQFVRKSVNAESLKAMTAAVPVFCRWTLTDDRGGRAVHQTVITSAEQFP
ncbi:hypothetical protein J6590_007975 [Homalodisca vitripennis]|nr:hypothetical protein J6590_007975 [Homalodisca vitripennis]